LPATRLGHRRGEEYTDSRTRTDVESRAIYDLLEQEICRCTTRAPAMSAARLAEVMKRSMSTVCPVFNTNRMVQEYMEKCYGPSGSASTG